MNKVVFHISIDDGFIEYRYPITLSVSESIDTVHRKICKSLRTIPQEGSQRGKLRFAGPKKV